MKNLLLTSVLVLAFSVCTFAQTNETSPCPTISITKPFGGYMGRGEDITLTANIEGYDWNKLNYNWKLSNNISIKGQGTPVIKFTAPEDMQLLNVTATVEIKGLSEVCKNNVSESFQILFNPGSPLVIDEYWKISLADEKVRLRIAINQLEKESNFIALFVINFTKKESYSMVDSRVTKITNFLTKTLEVSKDKFKFVFAKSDVHSSK